MAGTYVRTPEIRQKAREMKIGANNPNYKSGRPFCSECNKELYNYKAKMCWDCLIATKSLRQLVPSGKRHYKWTDRVYKKSKVNPLRTTGEYRQFRRAILERDKCCVECGSIERLELDHIKGFAEYPELALDMNNARILCHDCHKLTPNYGGRSAWKSKTK